MAAPDIDDLAARFAKQVNGNLQTFRADRAKKEKKTIEDIPELKVKVNKSPATRFRTPKEQALEVAEGQSWVCWGGHMTDKARHVVLYKDGDVVEKPKKQLDKEEFKFFTSTWEGGLKNHSLANFNGHDTTFSLDDCYHIEIPNSRFKRTDPPAVECIKCYWEFTRVIGMEQNLKFEIIQEVRDVLRELDKKFGPPAVVTLVGTLNIPRPLKVSGDYVQIQKNLKKHLKTWTELEWSLKCESIEPPKGDLIKTVCLVVDWRSVTPDWSGYSGATKECRAAWDKMVENFTAYIQSLVKYVTAKVNQYDALSYLTRRSAEKIAKQVTGGEIKKQLVKFNTKMKNGAAARRPVKLPAPNKLRSK